MLIISIICLRSPDHAAKAIEAGAGDLAVQAMKRFPVAAQMQRNACNMIRNIAVRSAENRFLLCFQFLSSNNMHISQTLL